MILSLMALLTLLTTLIMTLYHRYRGTVFFVCCFIAVSLTEYIIQPLSSSPYVDTIKGK